MSEKDNSRIENTHALKSEAKLEEYLKQCSEQEQIYSIALFDILGFSNFVNENGNDVILDLYNKLLELINKQKSSYDIKPEFAGSVVPVPISKDWKENVLIADANAYINVCHFSDTFIIYTNYNLCKKGFWLSTPKNEPYPLLLGEPGSPIFSPFYEKHHIYISFLQTCMEFFCQAIVVGIPLRGCISTGPATMNQYKSIYIGSSLVEAARGETVRKSIGISFGRSFANYHPVYNDYFVPYFDNIEESKKANYLSPMVVDWARYWRESPDYENYSLINCINRMNNNSQYSFYYDNAIKFWDFSEKNKRWFYEINRNDIKGIYDYYARTKDWYKSVV